MKELKDYMELCIVKEVLKKMEIPLQEDEREQQRLLKQFLYYRISLSIDTIKDRRIRENI